ncbi:hypothetical protein XELAEV_18000589mg [Xenopus laevis]|nr:hypothetical protein XELAEV_18000589mg [Xenopus laevis]
MQYLAFLPPHREGSYHFQHLLSLHKVLAGKKTGTDIAHLITLPQRNRLHLRLGGWLSLILVSRTLKN